MCYNYCEIGLSNAHAGGEGSLMNKDKFIALGQKECTYLKVEQRGMPARPDRPVDQADEEIFFDFVYRDNPLMIKIASNKTRLVTIRGEKRLPMYILWECYDSLEKLIMMFDGRFYSDITVTFEDKKIPEEDRVMYAEACQNQRKIYHVSDNLCCVGDPLVLYEDYISDQIFEKWLAIESEFGLVHEAVLFNMAETSITRDVKCARMIEAMVPLAEVISLHNRFFPTFKPDGKSTTLKTCLDAVISHYGKEIFFKEYDYDKEEFLSMMVRTRARVMHICQDEERAFSGKAARLYLVKLFFLYRVAILDLMGIREEVYRDSLMRSATMWNDWQGAFGDESVIPAQEKPRRSGRASAQV